MHRAAPHPIQSGRDYPCPLGPVDNSATQERPRFETKQISMPADLRLITRTCLAGIERRAAPPHAGLSSGLARCPGNLQTPSCLIRGFCTTRVSLRRKPHNGLAHMQGRGTASSGIQTLKFPGLRAQLLGSLRVTHSGRHVSQLWTWILGQGAQSTACFPPATPLTPNHPATEVTPLTRGPESTPWRRKAVRDRLALQGGTGDFP